MFSGRGESVELSELENEFYSKLPGIRTSLFDQLLKRGYYHARPDRVRSRWVAGAFFFGILIAAGGGSLAGKLLMTPVPFVVAGVAVAVILLIFAAIMPARTEAGARAR
ncbi:MAG TPA: hypothetical protein VIV09_03935, partial [Pseudolabrys sp.]